MYLRKEGLLVMRVDSHTIASQTHHSSKPMALLYISVNNIQNPIRSTTSRISRKRGIENLLATYMSLTISYQWIPLMMLNYCRKKLIPSLES